MAHINVEVKARCSDPDRVREILKSMNATFQGTDHQIDTYFKVPKGHLKMRKGNIENNLIYYERTIYSSGPKQADVILCKNPTPEFIEILDRFFGVLVVVDKTREIYWIGNVKFHIDWVEKLGSFVEIEAIDYEGTIGKEKLAEQCSHFIQLLNLNPDNFIAVSYSALLL